MGGGASAGTKVVLRAIQLPLEAHPHLAVWPKDTQDAFSTPPRSKIEAFLKACALYTCTGVETGVPWRRVAQEPSRALVVAL